MATAREWVANLREVGGLGDGWIKLGGGVPT